MLWVGPGEGPGPGDGPGRGVPPIGGSGVDIAQLIPLAKSKTPAGGVLRGGRGERLHFTLYLYTFVLCVAQMSGY